MIGQQKLIQTINKMIEDNTLPHFIILTGSVGSGKKLLAHDIANKLGHTVYIGTSVESIRTMIENCYKLVNATVYIIADADSMSVQAKNAMLKVTEEPPNNAYFIMTLEDAYSTLQTIRSRGTIFPMQIYSREELQEFIETTEIDEQFYGSVLKLAQTPGEILELATYDIKEFVEFVELVVDNIADTALANSFKIADKLALAKDADGYDLKLFFKAFTLVCLDRMKTKEDSTRYAVGVSITSGALRDIGINGISKQMLVDDWILEMRKAWN